MGKKNEGKSGSDKNAGGKSSGKGGAGKKDTDQESKVKGAQSINVRHILVRLPFELGDYSANRTDSARSMLRRRRPWRRSRAGRSLTTWRESSLKTRPGKARPYPDFQPAHSTDKQGLGGSLGWQARTALEPAFADVAFTLPVSTTAKPTIGEAKTGNGYHLIMVRSAQFLSVPWYLKSRALTGQPGRGAKVGRHVCIIPSHISGATANTISDALRQMMPNSLYLDARWPIPLVRP